MELPKAAQRSQVTGFRRHERKAGLANAGAALTWSCEGKGEHATGHHMDKGFRLSLHRTTPPPSPLCTLSACDEINGGLERWGTKLHSAAGISKCNQQEQKSQIEGQGSINDKRPEIIETTELQQFRRKSKIEDVPKPKPTQSV